MAATVSLKGIDEAIANLNYKNPQALKSKLVHAIRGFYQDESDLASLGEIDPVALVKALWDTGDDPAEIKTKRKNLSSTKSSVNSDLKKLFKAGKNPDGVIVGRDNIFVMSDEAKDKLISTFGADGAEGPAASLQEIAQSLNAIKAILAKPDAFEDGKGSQSLATLEDLRNTIQRLSQRIGTGEKASGTSEAPQASDAPAKPAEDEQGIGRDRGVTEEGPAEDGDPTGSDEANGEIKDPDSGEPEAMDQEPEPIDEADVVDDAEVVDEIVDAEEAPEETEAVEVDAEAIEDDDLEEVLEAIDVDEVDEDAQMSAGAEGVDEEAVLEDVSGDSDLEETASGEDKPVDALEGGEAAGPAKEVGLPAGSLGEEPGLDGDADTEKLRRLAEVFDGYLGTMERFYNQYLLIPAGDYRVGSKSPKRDERLEQTVRLTSFYVGKFPVTNALFEIFVEKTGYVTTAEKAGFGTVYYGRLCKEVDEKTRAVRFRCNGTVQSKTVEGAFWYQPCGPGSTLHRKRNHPVVQVSLEDAMAFAAWTGKRLPTEDEWEAAARTEKGYVYPWGNEWQGDACNVEDSAIADTTPVDAFKERTNALAIVDTLGNVLEWTSDVFQSTQHPTNSHRYYIVKGGSWVSEKDVRLFSRFKVKADAPSNILGFRCLAY